MADKVKTYIIEYYLILSMYFKLKWFWDFYSYQEVMGLIINNTKNTELICTHTEKISKPVIIIKIIFPLQFINEFKTKFDSIINCWI
jgi:hypothetical protein